MNKRRFTVLFIVSTTLLGSLLVNEIRSGGFLMPGTYSNLSYDPALEPASPSVEDKQEIENALSQKFYYLGTGRQAYAFVSEDGKYVLKFFRRLPLPFNSRFSQIFTEKFKEQINQYRYKKISGELKSCKIAYDTLKEESALTWIHLNKTPVSPSQVTLVDLLGIEHKTHLDNKEFILQKKAQLFYPYLDKKIKEGDIEGAKQAIHSMVQLIVERCKLGIRDEDPALHRNMGFIEGKAVFIDIARLKMDKKNKDPAYLDKKIPKILKGFKGWLSQNHPEFLSTLDEELNSLER